MAHKILVTSPEAKYLCYLFGAFLGFGLWTGTWPRACQYNFKGQWEKTSGMAGMNDG